MSGKCTAETALLIKKIQKMYQTLKPDQGRKKIKK